MVFSVAGVSNWIQTGWIKKNRHGWRFLWMLLDLVVAT
jgi:hypothetical protein